MSAAVDVIKVGWYASPRDSIWTVGPFYCANCLSRTDHTMHEKDGGLDKKIFLEYNWVVSFPWYFSVKDMKCIQVLVVTPIFWRIFLQSRALRTAHQDRTLFAPYMFIRLPNSWWSVFLFKFFRTNTGQRRLCNLECSCRWINIPTMHPSRFRTVYLCGRVHLNWSLSPPDLLTFDFSRNSSIASAVPPIK